MPSATDAKNSYTFHPELWEKYFGKNPLAPNIYGLHPSDSSSPLFWEAWAQLPPELKSDIIEFFQRASSSNKRLTEQLGSVMADEGISYPASADNFFYHLQSAVDRGLDSAKKENIGAWLRENEKIHLEKKSTDKIFAAQVQEGYSQSKNMALAKMNWVESTGKVRPQVWNDRGKIYVTIGDKSYRAYPATKNGFKVLQIEVPTEFIITPAWNPLESAKMTNILTKNIPPPSAYKTVLGPDGRFYIQDGNHRFAIHGKSRKSNLVEISDPPTTMNLSAYFDSIGRSQPTQHKF
jgi:hypothetical protein